MWEWLPTAIWVKGNLQEQKWVKDYCPLQHGGAPKSWENWITQHSLKAAQQGGQDPFQVSQLVECSPRQLSWFLLPGSWSGSQNLCNFSSLRVFCDAQFVFPSRGSNSQLLQFTLAEWDLVYMGDFTEFLKLFFSCFSTCLRSFSARWSVLISEETVTEHDRQ